MWFCILMILKIKLEMSKPDSMCKVPLSSRVASAYLHKKNVMLPYNGNIQQTLEFIFKTNK